MIWRDESNTRYFLLPEGHVLPEGEAVIVGPAGIRRSADPQALIPFELTRDQAHRWAAVQLGETLDELKLGIDERLAELHQRLAESGTTPIHENTSLTPSAVPALFQFLRRLPGVIVKSLGNDAAQLESARATMTDLRRSLRDAGIDVDNRFTEFPERLAKLRSGTRKNPSDEP